MCGVQPRCGSACQECSAFMPDAGVSVSAVALLWLLGAKIRYYRTRYTIWYPRPTPHFRRCAPYQMLLLLSCLNFCECCCYYDCFRPTGTQKRRCDGIIPHRGYSSNCLCLYECLVTATGQFALTAYEQQKCKSVSPQTGRSPSGHWQTTWPQDSKHHQSALCPLLRFRRPLPVCFTGPSRRQARPRISLATDS